MTQTNPPVTEEAVERVANDFAVKVTEHAVMELDADEENTAQIEAFGLLVEQEFRAAIAALTKSPPVVSEGLREALIGPEDDGTLGRFGWLSALINDLKAAHNSEREDMSIFVMEDPHATWEAFAEVEALIRDVRPILAMSVKSEATQGEVG